MRNGEFVKGEPVPGTRYRVIDLVGVGGMGSVYEVEHLELGKRFVLKALLSDLAMREDLVARLRNEQRALGRLEHPNIVAVTDAGATSGNVPYFVMERLDGETLAQRLRRVRRLSPVEALRIGNGVLEGLTAAHEIGVVHRDVKPPNIFLAAGNRPKILDFGVAKIADAGGAITARGVAVGTPRYMSPEQASGEPVDGRSDLYAVGLILFEMIAGAGPFDDARDANEMLLAHLGRLPARLSTRVNGVTPELDALVASLLAKDPDSRPPNARTAAAAVRALERTYGAAVEADAPTPYASEPPPPPGMTPHPGTTRPGTVTDELTRAQTTSERPRPEKDTLIDDRGSTLSGGTLAGRTATGAPAYGTKTELLTAVGPAPFGDVTETNTRVPVTPADGGRTLDPVPVDGPPSTARGSAGRRLLVVGGAAFALGGLLVVGRFAIGGSPAPGDAALASSSPAAAAPVRPPPPAPEPGPVPEAAPAQRAPRAAPSAAPLVAGMPPGPLPSAIAPARPSEPRPPAPALTLALPDPGLSPAPSPKISQKPAKRRAPSSGLPSSGL